MRSCGLRRTLLALALAALASGCANRPKPLCEWSNFPRLRCDVLQRNGANPVEQIEDTRVEVDARIIDLRTSAELLACTAVASSA